MSPTAGQGIDTDETLVLDCYTDRLSYRAGERVSVAASTRADHFSARISRVGAELEEVWYRADIRGTWQSVPPDASSRGCGWQESFGFEIPSGLRSGYYEVVLHAWRSGDGRLIEGRSFFVVRPNPSQPADLLLVLSTNTYAAYNTWGGPSLYTGSTRVSFRRPLAAGFLKKPEPSARNANTEDTDDLDHEHFWQWADQAGVARPSGSAGWHNWERIFVRWVEKQGYSVDIAVNSDLEFHPEVVDNTPLVVSVGHDEYWSWAMRDTLEGYISAGGNVAFFSGNSVCWQVRYEDDGATMVCYKSKYREDPVYEIDPNKATTMWAAQVVDRPENTLTGVSTSRGGYVRLGQAVPHGTGGYTIWRPNHWVFAGTGVRYGDVFGTADKIVSYEVDGCELAISPDDRLPEATGADGTPGTFLVLATAPARLWSRTEMPSRFRTDGPGDLESTVQAVYGDLTDEHLTRLSHGSAVMGTYTRGGTVFTAGTTEWVMGLRGQDPVTEKITRNVLDHLRRPSERHRSDPPAVPASPVAFGATAAEITITEPRDS